MKNLTTSDLELLEKYCQGGKAMVDPRLLREVERRGLYHLVNELPYDKDEAEAVLYSRLAAQDRVFGNDEIDVIAGKIERLKALRKRLSNMNITDAPKVKDILESMTEINREILNYFKG